MTRADSPFSNVSIPDFHFLSFRTAKILILRTTARTWHTPLSSGACPTTHRVRIPRLVLFRNYNQYNGLLRNITLASGSAGGMHADWVSGWTTAAFNQLITKCGNKDCGHIANGMKF